MIQNNKFVNVLNEIVNKHTDKSGIDEIEQYNTVTIESDTYQDLKITCEYKNQYTIAHYRDNDARKSDPMIRAELVDGEFDFKFMEYQGLGKQYTEDIAYIKDFARNTWAENLSHQF